MENVADVSAETLTEETPEVVETEVDNPTE